MDNSLQIERILAALDKIHAHQIFDRSPLMRAFLSYVVKETLQGREAGIKAYSIGFDALGKPAEFDPQRDPSVRVLAKRLRDSLDRYYEDESDYDVLILLRPGSYVPCFTYVMRMTQQKSNATNEPTFVQNSSSSNTFQWTSPILAREFKD